MYPFLMQTALTSTDCANIRAYAESHVDSFGKLDTGFWDGRVINISKITDAEISAKLIANRNALKAQIAAMTKHYNTDPLYGDTLQIVRWVKGYELKPHADQENPDGSPHPYHWRDFAAVTFLNDDFAGGELYFPHLAVTVKPIPGVAAIFPGSLQYLHGVAEVTSGTRYTLASFFTYDALHADYLDA
jgi:predicted 2-oxoglutarate/Fe(II)-dependent dioxygenase YbiX